MPIRTPEASDVEFLEQDGPDIAQVVGSLFRLRTAAKLTLSADDRILPPQESQPVVFSSSGSISFTRDFEHIATLHTKFGIRDWQRLSHNPVMDRARYERAKTEAEKQAVKEGVVADMEKNLYERARTAESTVVYYQDGERRIFNQKFPKEPFDVVLQRGLEYSKSKGYVDYRREAVEFEGWKKVMERLFALQIPLESKAIIISGPGLKKGTAFTDNFVDIFTKTLDSITNEVKVVMTRFAAEASYDEYRKIAVSLDTNYFDHDKLPSDEEIDIYFKENPIFIDSAVELQDARELFNVKFKKQTGATEEEKTKGYLEECKLFILHYADTVCAKFFEPENVKKAFNAVLNKFDSLRKGFLRFSRNMAERATVLLKNIQAEIDYYGGRKVEELMRGCGLSAGFSIGGQLIASVISVIRGLFGGSSKDKDYCIRCGACGKEIKCVVRKGERCPRAECKAVRRC